ncbi:hypothetical protein AB0O76_40595 [Streptomyces sp. NPDC086554]|uniref:hypothetical protein n=1 Tax=Streptomyces sp. NPDC086554 TaxID=3154864 RepID=UPI0034132896
MARNVFGGTAADAAENESGGRLPNLKGRVYLTEESPDEVKDLLDMAGNELKDGLLTDERGMIPMFQGPDGVEQLWVDFNAGRVMLTPNDVGTRLKAHTESFDPHGAKQYTDSRLDAFLSKEGGEVSLPANQRWLGLMNSSTAPGGDTIYQSNGGSTYNFTLRQNGSATFHQHTKSHIPVEIRAGSKSAGAEVNGNAFVINGNEFANGKGSFKVNWEGSIDTGGDITTRGDVNVGGTVSAANIGTARVFSGTTDPKDQGIALRPGDVWVNYGA